MTSVPEQVHGMVFFNSDILFHYNYTVSLSIVHPLSLPVLMMSQFCEAYMGHETRWNIDW